MARTTQRSSKGKKLYAMRDKEGKFKDIQTYKRAHAADLRKKGTKSDAPKKAKKKTRLQRRSRSPRSGRRSKRAYACSDRSTRALSVILRWPPQAALEGRRPWSVAVHPSRLAMVHRDADAAYGSHLRMTEIERSAARGARRQQATPQKQKRPAPGGPLDPFPQRKAAPADPYFRLSGTVPPVSISFAITCLCSQMFISAEPSSAPV